MFGSDITDVTLADQATNSIQADNANMAIQGNVAMKWLNLVANFGTNARDVIPRPNFEPIFNKSENVYFNEIQWNTSDFEKYCKYEEGMYNRVSHQNTFLIK